MKKNSIEGGWIDVLLKFESHGVIGAGSFPDFIQFEKTEGELFFTSGGILYGTPSEKLHGDFKTPKWLESVNISPKGETSITNLELKGLSGFGIVGSFKTDTAQKLLINEYMFEMDRYLQAGSIKHTMDSPVSAFTLTLENPINENPEYEGNVAVSEEGGLLSPGSKIIFELAFGDSEPYLMGTFYVDRSSFTLLSETVNVDGRNVIGKALTDQSFDEENSYNIGALNETLKGILRKTNITSDEMLVENTSVAAGYVFKNNMSYIEGILEILKALENWQIKELVDGTIVIGSPAYGGFEQNSRYTFYRNRDIFSRSIAKDDQEAYRRVCVHDQNYGIRIYKDVETYTGWNLQANKTLYINVPEGTSESDALSYANQIANNLQFVGKIESFTGPFRPQLLIGDEAVIISDTGSTNLGLITEITHRFGKNGFYTDFTVDSGGKLGRGRLSDFIGRITKEKTSSNRIYE